MTDNDSVDTSARPQPLASATVYGECVFWIALVGLAVAVIGTARGFLGADQVCDNQVVLDGMLAGKEAAVIWEEATQQSDPPPHHWYLRHLSQTDAFAMAGVAIVGIAAIIGMLAAGVTMVMKKERPVIFAAMALALVALLVLSASGIFALH